MLTPIRRIVFDCRNPQLLADFWANVTGYNKIQLDEEEAKTLAIIAPPEKTGPALMFYVTPDEKVVKNRVHVEINAQDLAAEVERIIALGATKVAAHDEGQVSWNVLADPEGNEFCVVYFPPQPQV